MTNVVPISSRSSSPPSEEWLTKRQLAAHYAKSLRWIESLIPGLPCVWVGNSRRFRLSEVERHLVREGIMREDTVKESV